MALHSFAWVYDGMGEFEQSNFWMNQAIEAHEAYIVYTKADIYDSNPKNP